MRRVLVGAALAGETPQNDVWPLRTTVWVGGFRNSKAVIQYMVCGSADGRPVSGVLVNYSPGSPQEPKFKWGHTKKETKLGTDYYVHPLAIDGKEVQIDDRFILYVNDDRGLPVALTLSPHEAALFRNSEDRSESKLLTFWDEVIVPRVILPRVKAGGPGDHDQPQAEHPAPRGEVDESQRDLNNRVIDSVEHLDFVDVPSVSFAANRSGRNSGDAAKLSHLEIWGELVSTNRSELPEDLADRVAGRIRTHLERQGCVIHGSGHGGMPKATCASISYHLNKAEGRIDVTVIDRGFESHGKNVVGQLMITVNEAR